MKKMTKENRKVIREKIKSILPTAIYTTLQIFSLICIGIFLFPLIEWEFDPIFLVGPILAIVLAVLATLAKKGEEEK